MAKYLLIFTSILLFSLLGFFSTYLMVDVPSIKSFADVLGQFRYMLKEITMFIGLLPFFTYILLLCSMSTLVYTFALKNYSNRLVIISVLNSLAAFTVSFFWAGSIEWDQYLR